jgi:fumarylacetoacetase
MLAGIEKALQGAEEMSAIRSWVEKANDPHTDFPLSNLPFGVFRSGDDGVRIGVAIGDSILDLRAAVRQDLLAALPREVTEACSADALNQLMSLGRDAMPPLRACLMEWLSDPAEQSRVKPLLLTQREVQMLLPARIGDYTDFYASIHHATNVGRLFRPDNPLLPNYKHIPIGYHGRASSLVVSGTEIRRPCGQIKAQTFGPTQLLDYEMEAGFFIGQSNKLGQPIPIDQAESHLFGLCLVNDWSARDIQSWEYQPLGPFLAKNFATSISPWIVTMEALEPFRTVAFPRPEDDPKPLAYLDSPSMQAAGGIDLKMEVWLQTARMRRENADAICLGKSNLQNLYWTLSQMLTHHASNGCNLQPADLMATGTVSGPTEDSLGCLLEHTKRGTEPVELPNGESRGFLEDGDEVILRGYCKREGYPRIGFGECRGVLLPAQGC